MTPVIPLFLRNQKFSDTDSSTKKIEKEWLTSKQITEEVADSLENHPLDNLTDAETAAYCKIKDLLDGYSNSYQKPEETNTQRKIPVLTIQTWSGRGVMSVGKKKI